jgi:cell cycle sensor histidine kinase DivJ
VVVQTAKLRIRKLLKLTGRVRFQKRLGEGSMRPSPLRSLLLASKGSVSTKQGVTKLPKAVPVSADIATGLWAWLAAVTVSGAAAAAFGGGVPNIAGAVALGVAPALAGFLLLPLLGSRIGAVGFGGAWLIAITGLCALSGGWVSAALPALMLLPIWGWLLRPTWALAGGAAALAGYAAAGWLGGRLPIEPLGAFPALLGASSIMVSAWLLSRAPRRGGEAVDGRARIAEVSHELRTPLTHILGFSEMIERQMFGDLSERYVEYAGLIRRSGAHLLGLVNDLLDLSRIEAGKYDLEMHRFDARDVVAEVVRLNVDAAATKSISLAMITPERPLMVRADDRALRRILINTVGNAVKFTPESGSILVTASAHDGALRIDTADSGAGIPEEERTRLGATFERGSAGASAEGTGLGLSLVRALAGLHGGSLSFHDAPSGGALVRVEMPVLSSD